MEFTTDESISTFVKGIAIGVDAPDEDHGAIYLHRLLGNDASTLSALTRLSESGISRLVDEVRITCFRGNIEHFIDALARYQEVVDIQTVMGPYAKIIDAAWKLALRRVDDAESRPDRLRLCCFILQHSSIEFDGKTRSLVRRYVHELGIEQSDELAEGLEIKMNRLLLRDIIGGAIFDEIGPWDAWCLTRKCLQGKKPSEAEAEMERLHEIDIIHAKLEGLWMHKIVMGPSGQVLMDEEARLIARLMVIDDMAGEWVAGNIPPWRKGESG